MLLEIYSRRDFIQSSDRDLILFDDVDCQLAKPATNSIINNPSFISSIRTYLPAQLTVLTRLKPLPLWLGVELSSLNSEIRGRVNLFQFFNFRLSLNGRRRFPASFYRLRVRLTDPFR